MLLPGAPIDHAAERSGSYRLRSIITGVVGMVQLGLRWRLARCDAVIGLGGRYRLVRRLGGALLDQFKQCIEQVLAPVTDHVHEHITYRQAALTEHRALL